MSDEEYMKFEITDQDLEHEFTQHRVRKLTKNQQIYGVWADNEDSDDENVGGRVKYGKKKKDYTAPVNFVPGGIHQPGPKSEEGKKAEEQDEEKDDVITDSSDEDIGRPSFSQNVKKSESSTPFFADSEMAGFRTRVVKKPNVLLMDQQGIGKWEKHNKGIGTKLMLQMGYQPGKGLGKELQGIDAPIEAHLRKGRGAIGAYGPEKKQKKMTGNESSVKENQQDEKSERKSLWRKETSEEPKKIRYVYKSIDEVIEESKKSGKKKVEISELSQVKVIDMTGPEQRVLSGYHAIAGVQKPTEEPEVRKDKKFSSFALPELLHNLNLLVDVAEQAIIENDRKLMYADDRSKVLQEQVKNLSKTVKQEKYAVDKLKIMIDAIESIVPSANEKPLTLEKAEQVFSSLKESHYTEFCAYEIPLLAVNVVRPLLNSFLEDWKPLQEPKKPLPEFVKWRGILLLEDAANQTVNSYKLNPYYKLVWDTWVPCLRKAISNWECRQWAPMVDVIMNWMPLLSKWILDNILQTMILKRIQQQVDEWNPMTDPVPIHSWIYPWINLLGKSFETTVYPIIRQKIGRALVNWHPSDSSARVMLQPWTSVFEQGAMEAFLVNNIVPKLEITLGQEFVINPHQQCLDHWNWVMEWSGMIPAHTMAALLDRCFFPKWLQTLSVWLNLNPDLEQVTKWFRGWETIIQENIREQPIVRDYLCTAVELMNGAMDGNAIPEPRPARKINEAIETIRPLEVPLTLKSIVQNRCEERGILWMPIPNRFMEAKQVYRCGKLQVYFDRNALLVSQGGGSFTPMSWQEMLENAI